MPRLANFILKDPIFDFKDGEPIPKIVALKLIQNYRDTGGWGGGQTRAIWFSKDDFIEMLGMIASFGGDGMRVYLGKYPVLEELPGTPDPVKYKNRITIVFVPTINKKDIIDVQGPIPSPTLEPNPGFNHGDLEP